MRFRSIAGCLAVAVAATCGVPAAASAGTVSPATRLPVRAAPRHQPPPGGKIPWRRYRTKPWHDAPGKVCTFGVHVTIVRDREQYRTLVSYPNGNPRVQEFRGPLFVRYTNTSTGASVLGNLSGYGWFYYRAGGGADIYVPNHIGLSVPVGNKGFPAGEWIVSGRAMVLVSRGGTINVVLIHARTENICSKLS